MSKTKTSSEDSNTLSESALAENWRRVQSTWYQKQKHVIEFYPNNEADSFWAWHIDLENFEPSFKNKESDQEAIPGLEEEDPTPNDDLQEILRPSFQGTPTFWKKQKDKIIPKGFFLPVSELTRFSNKNLGHYIRYAFLLQDKFFWVDYIRKLKETKDQKIFAEVPLSIIGLWVYFRQSISYYKKLVKEKNLERDSILFVLEERIDYSGFQDKFAYEQFYLLLQTALQKAYFPSIGNTSTDALADIAVPEVQKLWINFSASIKHYCQFSFNYSLEGNKKKKNNFNRRNKILHSEKIISKAFFQLFQEDIEKMAIQELLDDFHAKNLLQFFPENIQEELQNASEKAPEIEQIQESLENSSIIDRINSTADKNQDKQSAQYFPTDIEWQIEGAINWRQIAEDRREYILNHDKTLNSLKLLKRLALMRLERHLCNQLSREMCPIIRWDFQDEVCVPKWNILSPGASSLLSAEFEEKRKLEAKERTTLDFLLKEVKEAEELEDLDEISSQSPSFSIPAFQEEWLSAFMLQTKAIKSRINFRINAMKEYGIIQHSSQANGNKELWLDEMIQIEKEVSPYIGFVKNIFQSALPNRKTTEFNPYRHSTDGIEFDPDTIQDQNKWMSGEVMKTLRTKVTVGEVIQINAFALDSSGSMDHNRMRNLFKILYLLVLGLEDRKSYDAFHFFGTQFREGANFSSNYTNRSLLFSILEKIAGIKSRKIVYGGGGGTNMSEGIKQCHIRINEFSATLEKENPGINHLKSIFVITDGEPSVGIANREVLNKDIQDRREEGKLAINGIYLRADDTYDQGPPVYNKHDELLKIGTRPRFMEEIFGKDNYVESDSFSQAISDLVYVMSLTYKKQRKVFKQEQRLKKMLR